MRRQIVSPLTHPHPPTALSQPATELSNSQLFQPCSFLACMRVLCAIVNKKGKSENAVVVWSRLVVCSLPSFSSTSTLLASNRSIASQKKKNMQHQMRGPPPPPGARAALADACGSGVCPVTGHAWVRSSTTLVAWPVAPGARGSPAVRGLPSAATDDEFDDGIDFGGDDETDGVLVGGTAGSSSSGRQQQQSDMFSLDVVEREVAR